MSTPDETPVAPPPPPVPMYHPYEPQAMLSVTPGGPIPRWVIVVAVAYGAAMLVFGTVYLAFMIWSFSQNYDEGRSNQNHIGGVHASLDPAVTVCSR